MNNNNPFTKSEELIEKVLKAESPSELEEQCWAGGLSTPYDRFMSKTVADYNGNLAYAQFGNDAEKRKKSFWKAKELFAVIMTARINIGKAREYDEAQKHCAVLETA